MWLCKGGKGFMIYDCHLGGGGVEGVGCGRGMAAGAERLGCSFWAFTGRGGYGWRLSLI